MMILRSLLTFFVCALIANFSHAREFPWPVDMRVGLMWRSSAWFDKQRQRRLESDFRVNSGTRVYLDERQLGSALHLSFDLSRELLLLGKYSGAAIKEAAASGVRHLVVLGRHGAAEGNTKRRRNYVKDGKTRQVTITGGAAYWEIEVFDLTRSTKKAALSTRLMASEVPGFTQSVSGSAFEKRSQEFDGDGLLAQLVDLALTIPLHRSLDDLFVGAGSELHNWLPTQPASEQARFWELVRMYEDSCRERHEAMLIVDLGSSMLGELAAKGQLTKHEALAAKRCLRALARRDRTLKGDSIPKFDRSTRGLEPDAVNDFLDVVRSGRLFHEGLEREFNLLPAEMLVVLHHEQSREFVALLSDDDLRTYPANASIISRFRNETEDLYPFLKEGKNMVALVRLKKGKHEYEVVEKATGKKLTPENFLRLYRRATRANARFEYAD